MNFQNIPRKEKVIKAAFVPKLDALMFFDYKQVEYRVLAYYMAVAGNDTRMAEDFRAGKDPHSETGRLMLGLSPDHELTDAERQVGKTGNFSIMFLGGIPTIMRQLGCDKERAAELLQALRAAMPGLRQLQAEIRETLQDRRRDPYVTTLAGRHLHPKPGERDPSRLLLNGLIQGGAAEIMRRGLLNVHNHLLENKTQAHMVNVVHDEVAIDAPKDELEFLMDSIPNCMDSFPNVSEVVPIETDLEVSFGTWADKAKYEPE